MDEQRYEIDQNPELEAEAHRRLKQASNDQQKAEAFALLVSYGWYDASGEWIYYLKATPEQHRERAQAKRAELDRLRRELDDLEGSSDASSDRE